MGYPVNLPPIPPAPPDATAEERRQMYEAYRAELQRLNPWAFNPDGSPKRAVPLPWVISILLALMAAATVALLESVVH